MDILYVVFGVFLCIFNIGSLNAQLVTPLILPSEPVVVNPGDSANLTCVIPEYDMISLVGELIVEWHFKDAPITILNSVLNKREDKYVVKFDVSEEGNVKKVFIFLQVLDVQQADAGLYSCNVFNKEDRSIFNVASTTITPREKISSMEFELDGERLTLAQSQVEPAYKQLHATTYTPKCVTRGSFPAAKIEMYKGTVKLNGQVSQKATDNEVIFTASPIKMMSKDSNVTLKCVAMVPNLPDSTVERSWRLDIITIVPDVQCLNTSAIVGYKYHQMSCSVVMNGISCSDLLWENKKLDIRFITNNKWKKYETECTQTNNTAVTTHFIIKQMEKDDFKNWYLVYESDHGEYKSFPNVVEQRFNAASQIYSGASILVFIVTMVIQSLL